MKSGNNIDKRSILEEFSSYNAYRTYGDLLLSGSFSGDKRYQDAGKSNTFILTNAYKGEVKCDKGRTNGESPQANSANDLITREIEQSSEVEPTIRTDFPETWFFETIEADDNGLATFEKEIPDSMTTWDISGFALSDEVGFGIAEPITLTVSQQFFVLLHIPYSIYVGEILKVDVTVFNYLRSSSNVEVTISFDENEPSFELYDSANNNGQCTYTKSNSQTTKTINAKFNTGTSTHFYIKARKAGKGNLRVRATIQNNRNNFDEVMQTIKVKNEGLTKYTNEAQLLKATAVRNAVTKKGNILLNFSETSSTSSIKIDATVVGNLMGPALDNIDKLM